MEPKKFRESIGLSQAMLSAWLGISRDLLAQIELDRRSLSGEAMERMSLLSRRLQAIPPSARLEKTERTTDRVPRNLVRKIHRLENEIMNLQFQLNELDQQIARWEKALLLCEDLKKDPPYSDPLFEKFLDGFEAVTEVNWLNKGKMVYEEKRFYLEHKSAEKAFLEARKKALEEGF